MSEPVRAVFFGDSWTIGSNAEPKTRGFAYLTAEAFGWEPTVLGGGGSGYTRSGPVARDFITRMREADDDPSAALVILQGSVNDTRKCYLVALRAAPVIRLVQKKYPAARIVVLGPAPAAARPSLALRVCSWSLAATAALMRVPYISPIRERWITPENHSEIIDAEWHPGTAGHQHLATRLIASLTKLAPRVAHA